MPDSSDTPQALGPYRLETVLGRGGMGEVWLARDRRLDRRVAIKHVRASVVAGDDAPKARARFRREAWATAKIAHPSVVPVFDVVENASGDWIVMEWVDGPSLHDLIDLQGQLGVDAVLRYGQQIAEGLAAAHAVGLVHRDLKTENVMVAPSGHAKILDFGLAKALTKPDDEVSLTVSGEVMGTVRCMSPEQARGFDVDARSDLFALGTLLYEALTGSSPFRGETPLDTLSRVVTHEPTPVGERRPDVPAELSVLIEHLLEKSPERRPQTASAVAHTLEGLYLARNASPPTTVPEPGTAWQGETVTGESQLATPSRPAASQRGSRIAIMICGVVLTALGLGWWAGHEPTDPPVDSPPVATRPVDVDPGTLTSAYEAFVLGQQLLDRFDRKRHLPAAIEAFRRAIAIDDAHAAAHAGLARALWLQYRTRTDPMWLTQATQAARRAVTLDEHLVAAQTSFALVAAERGELDAARRALDIARRTAPADDDVFYVEGKVETAAGDLEGAIQAYRRAIELAPKRHRYYESLASLLLKTGALDEAEAALKQSLELAPDSVYGRRNLAAVLQFQGRMDEAATQLQKALEIQPSATLYSNLGTLLFFQGLYEAAADAYERALRFDGAAQRPTMWANLGDARRWVPGQTDRASEAFQQAIRLAEQRLEDTGNDWDLRSRLATYQAKAEQCESALGHITALAESSVQPDLPTLYRTALVAELCGRRDDALERLDDLLAKGYPAANLMTDPELLPLRSDPEFQILLSKHHER